MQENSIELLSSKKIEETRAKLNFPKSIFGDNTTSEQTTITNKQKEISLKTLRTIQTETPTTTIATQTKADNREKEETRERDPLTCIHEKKDIMWNHYQCNKLTVRSQ